MPSPLSPQIQVDLALALYPNDATTTSSILPKFNTISLCLQIIPRLRHKVQILLVPTCPLRTICTVGRKRKDNESETQSPVAEKEEVKAKCTRGTRFVFSFHIAVKTTLAERQFFHALTKLIGQCAAKFSLCGIAAIVSKMGYLDEGCHIGADGSLYNICSLICGIVCGVAYLLSCRNTLGLPTGYMRDLSIFLVRKEGLYNYSFHIVIQTLGSLFFNNL